MGRRDRVCQEPAFRLEQFGNGHRCSPIAPRCGPPSTTRTSTMRRDHRCTDCATLQWCSSAWWGIVSQAMVTCARRVAIAVRVTCGGRHIYTCACARRQRCIRVHTNRHVSPPHRPTSPYGHRARYAVRCTTHVACMRTTHGSSDLPSEIMGDMGGTGHWYFGVNPKPPPPPLPHTGGSAFWTPDTFIYIGYPQPPPLQHPPKPPPSQLQNVGPPPKKTPPPRPPHVHGGSPQSSLQPPKAPPASLQLAKALSAALQPPKALPSCFCFCFCSASLQVSTKHPPKLPPWSISNPNGPRVCCDGAFGNVRWVRHNWVFFFRYQQPHLELQTWWRYWSYRCRICHRVHHQCYEHSIWHHSKHVRPHWYRIE